MMTQARAMTVSTFCNIIRKGPITVAEIAYTFTFAHFTPYPRPAIAVIIVIIIVIVIIFILILGISRHLRFIFIT